MRERGHSSLSPIDISHVQFTRAHYLGRFMAGGLALRTGLLRPIALRTRAELGI